MSAPGVGVIVTTIYIFAIDDPARFTSWKRIGAIGLTPKRYSWGEMTGRQQDRRQRGAPRILRGSQCRDDTAGQGWRVEMLKSAARQAGRHKKAKVVGLGPDRLPDNLRRQVVA